LFHVVRDRVSGLAGVESVSLTSRLPATNRGGSSTLEIEGYEPAEGTGRAEVIFALVDPGYFDTMRIPLLHGRVFSGTDRLESERVAIINEAFAKRYWGIPDVVGRRYRHEGAPDSWVRIIGVGGDAKVRTPDENPTPMFFRPLAQGQGAARLFVVARTQGDPAAIVQNMRQELRTLDANVPVYQAGTMNDHVGTSLAMPRTAAVVIGLFGALALLLTSLGLYAVVAFAVARRTTEMGIRMALGANGGRVVLLMMKETMAVVGAGLVVGIGLAALAAPVLETMLFGVTASDPATFFGMGLVLVSVALVAAYLPARRAAQTDPVRTLRFE